MRNVRKISKKYFVRQIVACFLVYCLFFSPAVMADIVLTGQEPGSGITVTPGTLPDTTDMTAGNNGIGYFSDFDIALGHTVSCVQGNPAYNALFKVNSVDGTQIYGIFNSDGNIYLQDLQGILIGPTGQVNTNQFYASTVFIKNSDWQNFVTGFTSQLKFERGIEDPKSEMENQGTINASRVYLIGSKVLNSGTINAPDTLVMAAGKKIYLTHEGSKVLIKVPTDLMTPYPPINKVDIDAGSTINAGQVVLAAGDVFSAALDVGSLAATANGDITLEGTVTTIGDITLVAGDDVDAQGLDAGGSIDISASDTTINLHENVTADVDIILNNDTVADAGITLKAGQNVDIAAGKTVTALGSLGIEATSGEIMADTSIIDMAANGETLTLTQNANMDLEQDFSVNNRTNTDLFADSTGGSVTSDAAGEWNSITAHAAENITLSDISEIITTGALHTDNGDIKVTAESGKVYAEGAISAGRDVIITATDESSDSIFLYDGAHSVDAGRDIWLNNNTYADGPTKLTAGQDIRLGYNENLDTYDAKTLTAEESLTLEADRHITLGGDVTVIGSEPETLIVKADADTVNGEPEAVLGGDVHAMGKLTTIGGYDNDILVYGDNIRVDGMVSSSADIEISAFDDVILNDNVKADGDIDIYSSDDTTYLGGDLIEAVGNVTLHNNTVLNGGDQRIDALTGKLITDDGVNMDKSTAGDVDLGGGLGIELGGNVTASGMTDTDTMTLEDNVTANGTDNQRIDAGAGTLAANGSINKITSGDLNLGGDDAIDLDGTVDVDDGSLTIEDDFSAAADLIASQNVTLGGTATLDGSVNQKIEATNGSLYANDWVHKTGTGNLDMFGGFEGPWSTAYSVWTNEVRVEDGELSIRGDGSVTMRGPIYSTGNMLLSANDDEDTDTGILHHYATTGTIESRDGQIDMSATGSGIYLYGGPSMPDAYVSAGDDILLRDNTKINGNRKIIAGDDVVLAAGMDITNNGSGDLTIEAGDDILLGVSNVDSHWTNKDVGSAGNVTADGDLTLTAGDEIHAHGKLLTETDSGGNITATAGDDIHLYNTPTSADADGTLTLTADSDDNASGNLTADGALYGNMALSGVDVTVYGDVESDGVLDVDADDDIVLTANVSSVGEMTMDAGSDIELNGNAGNTSSESTISLNAGDSVTIGKAFGDNGNVTANGNMDIIAGTDSEDNVKVFGKLTTTNGGNIDVTAGGDIILGGSIIDSEYESAQADGDLTLDAGDDVHVLGDLISNNGSIELSSDNTTTYLGGDVTAATDVTLNNDTVFFGCGDQKVDAQAGMITAKGSLWKNSYWGSLYLDATGDISLADYVGAYGGGISIISKEGAIFTPDHEDNPTDTLNIGVYGWSDDYCGDGVVLPHGPGLAAIVISSAKDLKLGSDAELVAKGYYDDTTVDDRRGVDFLDEPLTSIGGIIRDEGEPFDVAVYLASTDGDVDVSSEVTIGLWEYEDEMFTPQGTMVIDAFDTVTFDKDNPDYTYFEDSLADGFVGDRLEVCSRKSEWLYEAVGRLPYVYGGGPFPTDYSYILRGAGRGNPLITEGGAWVLEDPTPPAPLYWEAGEKSEKQEFREGGCTALMNWLAGEIGVPAEDIQVAVAGAYALSTDVQPCEMCARLKDASNILQDVEGTQIAALARVVNEFVTTPAPPSPEQMTSIASALAEHTGDGTHYAAAGEWIDALVAYIGIMRTEMGYSASDAASFAEKYLTRVNESGNAALVAYVQARLAALGG